MTGKAVDFNFKGESAIDTREWLADNERILPYPIRLEVRKNGKQISWVHLDMYALEATKKITYFNA